MVFKVALVTVSKTEAQKVTGSLCSPFSGVSWMIAVVMPSACTASQIHREYVWLPVDMEPFVA